MNEVKSSFICTYIFAAIMSSFKGALFWMATFLLYCLLWNYSNLEYLWGVGFEVKSLDIRIILFDLLIILYLGAIFILIYNHFRKMDSEFALWEFAGSLICFLFKGFGTATVISQLPLGDWLVWGIIILLLFIVLGAIAYKKYMDRGVNNDKGSSFLTDQEIKEKGDDLIGVSWKAENFAKQIYNQDVRDSLIYGVEAPWGTGKSSFVNLCKATFISCEMLLFHFSALSSGPKAPISQVFMHDLIAFINKEINDPILRILLGQYWDLLAQVGITISGISFKFNKKDIERRVLFDKISKFLILKNQRMVIIIDDLDRISANEVYQILFSIKNLFNFPGISYILCYDMECICKQGNSEEIQRNVDFLQKFIQVKISLFVDKEQILQVLDNQVKFHKLMEEREAQSDEDAIRAALGGIKAALTSKDAYEYYRYLGNIRAIKRIINTILLLNIQLVDFHNYDFNPRLLLNLLLLYLDYPSVFRRIYISETWSKENIYTYVYDYTDRKSKRKNSEAYKKELAEIEKYYPAATFLVEKLFLITDEQENEKDNLLETVDKESLKEYLNLIVNQHARSLYEQSIYYINLLDQYAQGEWTLPDVLQKLPYCQKWYMKLFATAAYRNASKFTEEQTKEMISYILAHRYEYSYRWMHGGREEIVYWIFMLLGKDKKDADKSSKFPYEKNGELLFKEEGIIDEIAGENVLGIYDLMIARWACCAKRMNGFIGTPPFCHIINIIGKYNNTSFEYVGDVNHASINQMRVFSQRCYHVFYERYIKEGKSFWHEIDLLEDIDICGKFDDRPKGVEAKKQLEKFKTDAKTFLAFQFGSNDTMAADGSVPCGYYDCSGNKDDGQIRKHFSQYMLDVVFKDSNSFIDFLRIIMEPQWTEQTDIITGRMFQFIDEDCLIQWWRKNRNQIKNEVHIPDMTISYKSKSRSLVEGVRLYFDDLDQEVDNEDRRNNGY